VTDLRGEAGCAGAPRICTPLLTLPGIQALDHAVSNRRIFVRTATSLRVSGLPD